MFLALHSSFMYCFTHCITAKFSVLLVLHSFNISKDCCLATQVYRKVTFSPLRSFPGLIITLENLLVCVEVHFSSS
jgi:hypothetical protein